MWQRASIWLWANPWYDTLYVSVVKPRFIVCSNGLGLSTARSVSGECARPTTTPSRASERACLRFVSVMRLAAPSWSLGPQRPQFFTWLNIWSNSSAFRGNLAADGAGLMSGSFDAPRPCLPPDWPLARVLDWPA